MSADVSKDANASGDLRHEAWKREERVLRGLMIAHQSTYWLDCTAATAKVMGLAGIQGPLWWLRVAETGALFYYLIWMSRSILGYCCSRVWVVPVAVLEWLLRIHVLSKWRYFIDLRQWCPVKSHIHIRQNTYLTVQTFDSLWKPCCFKTLPLNLSPTDFSLPSQGQSATLW